METPLGMSKQPVRQAEYRAASDSTEILVPGGLRQLSTTDLKLPLAEYSRRLLLSFAGEFFCWDDSYSRTSCPFGALFILE